MPSKVSKKSSNKKKQNGKKAAKNQTPKVKQKYELETSLKDQISELDKEILSIKINEYEHKLNRKRHLCYYMEEEISIYKTLYEEKQLLKSESMKLLNDAFEDFATEIFLLDQEIFTMQFNYNEILKEHKFCDTYREKVQILGNLEAKLGEKLFESEKCSDEIHALVEKLESLQEKANLKKEVFLSERKNIIAEFDICLSRIQDELNCTVNKIIRDNSLKLNLLPVPYKTLFLSGLLSKSWLDSALKCLNFLQLQNVAIENMYNEMQFHKESESKKMKEYFSDEYILSVLKGEARISIRETPPIEANRSAYADFINTKQDILLLQHLEKMSLNQQNKVKSMKSEVKKLEHAICTLETSGEISFQKSYLIQIICKAGSILKKEL